MVLPLFGMGILTYTGTYAHVCNLMCINTALWFIVSHAKPYNLSKMREELDISEHNTTYLKFGKSVTVVAAKKKTFVPIDLWINPNVFLWVIAAKFISVADCTTWQMFRNEVGYLLCRVCFNPLYRLPAAPAVVVWKHDRALIRTSQEEGLLKEKSPFSSWLGKTEKIY